MSESERHWLSWMRQHTQQSFGRHLLSHKQWERIEDAIYETEAELADYKKHFEPQMIQSRLLSKALDEQSKTYKTHEEQRQENVDLRE